MPYQRLFFSLLTAFFLATPSHADSSKPRIGMLLPLSSNYAAIGEENRQGVEIALEELGNPDFEVVYGDSRADPNQSISEYRRMSAMANLLGIYAFRGPVGMSINPLSNNDKLPLLGGVGNKLFAKQNPYAFQMWSSSEQEGQFLAEQIVKRGLQRVAFVTAQDDWPVSFSEGVRTALNNLNTKLVFDEEVNPSTTDFRALVTRLSTYNPDCIFVNVGLQQIGPLVRQIREQHLDSALFSNFWVNKPEVIEAAGTPGVEGVMYVEMTADLPMLKEQVMKRYGRTPSGATLSAYTATMMIGNAIKNGPENLDKESFYSALLEQKAIHTKNGEFPVIERFVQFPLRLLQITGSKAEGAR